ncbi:uncharacterized protein LOC113752811 [Coffea eugenioides]|uniref:uncharacterized protein LOC113752811 n=1 Tax=Coffea eugenioides TaxID=49369 RepID=UPI000F60E239|nr:uncharacterized protein LOC113752811 [Coffea eugenioides]
MKHKLKHFIWKCLHGVFPVNAVIRERCSKGDPMCKCCGESTETIEHCLFLCDHSKVIWKAAPLNWDGLELFSNRFWHWNARQFEERNGDPRVAVEKALREWREYQEAQDWENGTEGDHARKDKGSTGWRKPRVGWVKMNSDATLHLKADRAG